MSNSSRTASRNYSMSSSENSSSDCFGAFPPGMPPDFRCSCQEFPLGFRAFSKDSSLLGQNYFQDFFRDFGNSRLSQGFSRNYSRMLFPGFCPVILLGMPPFPSRILLPELLPRIIDFSWNSSRNSFRDSCYNLFQDFSAVFLLGFQKFKYSILNVS